MTSKTEELKLALEALTNAIAVRNGEGGTKLVSPLEENAITAIKEALAQPAQEPVALVVSTAPDRIWLDLGFDPQDEYEVIFHELHDVTWSQDNASGNGIEYVRADTTPPQRPWVGLTDEQMWELWNSQGDDAMEQQAAIAFARVIKAKLKELNT